jgi:S-adenosylmethionine hydrolase
MTISIVILGGEERMKIITFLTDFGQRDSYVAQMKGVASSLTDAHLIDITHEISPHAIREGAFTLRAVVPFYPIGTVHVAVVDPGVGTTRRGLIVTTKEHIFVGPDNGLLMPAAHLQGDIAVYEISNPRYMLPSVSSTFHGRDIFTPVAAHIIRGVPFNDFGPKITDAVDLTVIQPTTTDEKIAGKVIHIDRFGNIITNVDESSISRVANFDQNLRISLGATQKKLPFVRSYGHVQKGEALATIGSYRYLEISINQGNAAEQLHVSLDDDIDVLLN